MNLTRGNRQAWLKLYLSTEPTDQAKRPESRHWTGNSSSSNKGSCKRRQATMPLTIEPFPDKAVLCLYCKCMHLPFPPTKIFHFLPALALGSPPSRSRSLFALSFLVPSYLLSNSLSCLLARSFPVSPPLSSLRLEQSGNLPWTRKCAGALLRRWSIR